MSLYKKGDFEGKSYSHRSSHGTYFYAYRCDFVGGVVVVVPLDIFWTMDGSMIVD